MQYCLTNFQKNLWVLSQSSDIVGANYNIYLAYNIRGSIDYDLLKKAAVSIFDKHEILHCAFYLENELKSIYQNDSQCIYILEDLTNLSEFDKSQQLSQLIQKEITMTFDLSTAPLIRIKCLKLTPFDCVLLITAHHIISDGYSFVTFLEELFEAYCGDARKKHDVQFSEYCSEQKKNFSKDANHLRIKAWQKKIKRMMPLELPIDFPRPKYQQFEGAVYRAMIPLNIKKKVQDFSQNNGITIYMCLFAAYVVLLHRCTGQNGFCIGMPINLRTKLSKKVIGPCINMLPIANEVESTDTFLDVIRKTKLEILEALEYSNVPFDTLIQNLNLAYDTSRNHLYQTIFVWQNLVNKIYSTNEIKFEPFNIHNGFVKLDLEFYINECSIGNLQLQCEYKTSLFSHQTIEGLTLSYIELLSQLIDNENIAIDRVSFIRDAIKNRILFQWNDTYKKYDFSKSVINIFEDQVDKTPHQVAICYTDSIGETITLSYEQFNNNVNILANYLKNTFSKSSNPIIVVLFERSLEMYISIYAAMKLGTAYLPMDPTWPKNRIKCILEDSRPTVILTNSKHINMIDISLNNYICDVDMVLKKNTNIRSSNLKKLSGLKNLPAYVIYTSGSTGKPKGVVNTHYSLLNRLLWMQEEFKLLPNDRVLQKTPYTFDVSVWEIFLPLLTGATLVIAPHESHRDCVWLQKIIIESYISVIHFVPSMLNAYLLQDSLESHNNLRYVICSGEELLASTVTKFYKKFPNVELYNLYGPTEACIDVTYWCCPKNVPLGKVPIGKPISNTSVYILDRNLDLVPENIIGEIYLEGANLALGYINQNELTQQKFFDYHLLGNKLQTRLYKTGDLGRYTHDGLIVYLGRQDEQIKLNGNRIELSEIENVLALHPNIKQAAVLVKKHIYEDELNRDVLVGYVELVNEDIHTCESEIKSFIANHLPNYMVCSYIVLCEIPHTTSGKVDKKLLSETEINTQSLNEDENYFPPINDSEKLLQEAWSTILNRKKISRFDNFFSLGGDSILIIQVLTYLRKQGVKLSVQDFFKSDDLEKLAKMMKYEISDVLDYLLPTFHFFAKHEAQIKYPKFIIEDLYPLSRLQQGIYYFHLEAKYAYKVYSTWYLIKNKLNINYLQSALDIVLERHPILRSYIDNKIENELTQIVVKNLKINITYIDISFLDDIAAKEYMRNWLIEEQSTPFDWNTPPLLRVTVHQLSESLFYITLSEPWLDGWSVSIVGSEILSIYTKLLKNQSVKLQKLNINYAYFIKNEKDVLDNTHYKMFWKDYLRTARPCLIENINFNQADDYKMHREQICLPNYFLNSLKKISRELNVSIKHILLSAHVALVRLITGTDDIITGLMSNARPELVGAESMVGIFLNVLPFRINISGFSWKQLIKEVYATESNILPYRFYPASSIHSDQNNTVLFNTLFNFTDFHLYRALPNDDDFSLLEVSGNDQTYYAMTSHFSVDLSNEKLILYIDTNHKSENIDWVTNIGNYYRFIIDEIIKSQDLLVNDLYTNLSYQSSSVACDMHLPDESIIFYFLKSVELYSDKHAIIFNDDVWTYGKIISQVSSLIYRLENIMPYENIKRVVVISSRSADLIVAILAIFAIDATYIPISESLPINSINEIVEDCQPQIILYEKTELVTKLLNSTNCVNLVSEHNSLQIHPILTLENAQRPRKNPAILMYTSGSTGKPKGVILSHIAVLNRFHWMWNEYPFHMDEIVCGKTSINFIDSVWELLGGLVIGIKTILFTQNEVYDIDKFVSLINKHKITRITLVPTLLNEIIKYCNKLVITLDNIKICIVSGESFSASLATQAKCILPNATILNLYGSTEMAGDISFYEVKENEIKTHIPIGKSLPNNQIHIVGENSYPLPLGYIGNIMARGFNIADGYTNKSQTDGAFNILVKKVGTMYQTGDIGAIDHEGNIICLGRSDRQIKVRGIRIEPALIESIIKEAKNVKHVYVTLAKDYKMESRLIAYYTLNDNKINILPDQLREILQQKLSYEMIPEHFVQIKEFPLTRTGKIDHTKLCFSMELNDTSSADDTMTPSEKKIAELWKEILNIQSISVERNFFMHGGNSLMLMQLILRIKREFGLEIELQDAFKNITIKKMANFIDQQEVTI